MPYAMRRKGNRYEVYNTETDEVKSRTTKRKAEKQLRLLRGIEKGWQPTNEPDTFTRGGRTLRITGGQGGTKR